jgi:hypothetical protein
MLGVSSPLAARGVRGPVGDPLSVDARVLRVGSDSLGAFLHVSIDHAPRTAATLVVYSPPADLPAVIITHRSVFPGFGLTRYRFSGPESGVPVPPNVVPSQSGTAEVRRFGGGIDFELWSRGTSLSIVRARGRTSVRQLIA